MPVKKDYEGRFLQTRDENMNLKKQVNESQTAVKEMSTKLLFLTQKMRKLQDSPAGAASASASGDVEEQISRLRGEKRELSRKNEQLENKVSYFKNVSQKRAGTDLRGAKTPVKSGRLPGERGAASASASSARGTAGGVIGGGGGGGGGGGYDSAVEDRLREKLRDSQQQVLAMRAENERLGRFASSSSNNDGEMNALRMETKEKQAHFGLLQSKYEQMEASFKALKSNHEKALEQADLYNKELKEERRKALALAHEKKVLELTAAGHKELEETVSRLRREKRQVEEENNKLMTTAFSGENSRKQKESVRSFERRISELEGLNADLTERLRGREEEMAASQGVLREFQSTSSITRDESSRLEAEIKHLHAANEALSENLSIFTGDTGINIDELEQALSMVKRGDVSPTGGRARTSAFDGNSDSAATPSIMKLQGQNAELVQELSKTQQLLTLQSKINDDYKAEVTDLERKYSQVQHEYEHKLQETSGKLHTKTERITSLESRLRNQLYSTGGSMPSGKAASRGNSKAPLSDGTWDDSATQDDVTLASDENVFEIKLQELLLDDQGDDSAATFFTYDFFEHETQTTPVVSGSSLAVDFTSTFVVKVDSFFLNYLATKTMKLELFRNTGGMGFTPLASCNVAFRPIIDQMSKVAREPGMGSAFDITVTGDLISISGGSGEALKRAVIGTVTYSLRFKHPVANAVHLVQSQLAAAGDVRASVMATSTPSDSRQRIGAMRELCVRVTSCAGLSNDGAPYVHYRMLDFPEHFTAIARGAAPSFNDLECFQIEMNPPIERWLSTSTLDFCVFDDSNEDPNFYFGVAKVQLSALVSESGRISETVNLVGKKGAAKGSVSVEVFWSQLDSAAAPQTAPSAGGTSILGSEDTVELSSVPAGRKQRYADPNSDIIAVTVHSLKCPPALVSQDASQLFIALEFLSQGDGEEEQKEMETGSHAKARVVKYDYSQSFPASLFAAEVKGNLGADSSGSHPMEFVVVSDPGGDGQVECSDLGTARFDLRDVVLAGDAKEKWLDVVDGDTQAVIAQMCVSVTAKAAIDELYR